MAKAAETSPDSSSQKYSIAEIRAKLREQLTSIHSIWCEYKVQWSSDYSRNEPDTWPTFIWAQQGSRMLHRMHPHQPKSLKGKWREEFESFDGQTGYQVLFQRDGKSLQERIHRLSAAPPNLTDHLIPAHHIGLLIRGSTSNLLALVERPGIVAVSGPSIDGHSCIQIDLGQYNTANHLFVYLDPEVDFLPRRIESFPARLLTDTTQTGTTRRFFGQPGDIIWQIGIESFFEVEDLTLGRKRWFPQRLVHNGQMTAIVDKVSINEKIPITTFQPVLAKGTTLVDNPGTPRMRESLHGQPAQLQVTVSAKNRDDEGAKMASVNGIEAKLSNGVTVEALLVCAAFLMISVAIGVARRRA